MLTRLVTSPQPLRAFFADAGYTEREFQANMTFRDLMSARQASRSVLLDCFSEPTPLHLLLRWFFLGQSGEIESSARLIPELLLEQMVGTGMLVREAGRFTPMVMLSPYEGFLFAADPLNRLDSGESSDLVSWPNPTTRVLRMFTLRRSSRATLDLGTGCGILAVLAASHSCEVVATDLNPRAKEFTSFNTWLNSVTNVECLIGDTYEPVRGRSFDLILSNPPFYVTPFSHHLFSENSMDLDDFCRQLIQMAPVYLNDRGYLQITLEWVQKRGQPWQERIVDWLKDTGCDAWVLHTYSRTAGAYALERIGGKQADSPETAKQQYEAWMDYYRVRGVEEIHGGILAMRRRSGKNWIRIEEGLNLDTSAPFGESVEEVFSGQDALETSHSMEQMLAWKPRLAPGTHIDQQLQLVAGQWKILSMQLRRPTGLPSSLRLEPEVADFLRHCDGTEDLRELTRAFAETVKIDPEQVQRQCCTVIRRLVEHRLVLV